MRALLPEQKVSKHVLKQLLQNILFEYSVVCLLGKDAWEHRTLSCVRCSYCFLSEDDNSLSLRMEMVPLPRLAAVVHRRGQLLFSFGGG